MYDCLSSRSSDQGTDEKSITTKGAVAARLRVAAWLDGPHGPVAVGQTQRIQVELVIYVHF